MTRADDLVISAGPVRVHSSGILLTFCVRFGPGRRPGPLEIEELNRLLKQDRRPSAHRLLLGVRYADGHGDTNVEQTVVGLTVAADAGPRLDLQSGGSRGSLWELTYWLWPAPVGDMCLLAAWPEHLEPGETVLTDADLSAARNAIQILDP